ncbi:MAG TPA: beta-propeller fold lactonase family protein [Bacteroidota bacterium]|nr:beta-propeller fold lactonase family protein [Bacteroidota bacterium]
MHHLKMLQAAALVAALSLAGCQNHSSMNSVTEPDVAPGVAMGGASSFHFDGPHTVYTLSNATAGNSILRYSQGESGALSFRGEFPTGGKGSGGALASQGSLIRHGEMFFAVNAGSNEISALRETGGGMRLIGKVASGGSMPVSVTVHGDLLYVLNEGGDGNITGYRGAASGHLTMINGSSRPLSGSGVGPAQVEFNPSGTVLVVTEKNTNKIDTYRVGFDGKVQGPDVQNSTGQTPYGFEFTPSGQLIVSDAFGGTAGLSSLTSYRVGFSGGLDLITGPVQNGQAAACWVVVTDDGRFTYTTNAGTNNISGYQIRRGGALVLLHDGGVTATSDASPNDASLSNGSRILFVRNAGGNSITSYAVNPVSGALTAMGKATGLPASAVGLASM